MNYRYGIELNWNLVVYLLEKNRYFFFFTDFRGSVYEGFITEARMKHQVYKKEYLFICSNVWLSIKSTQNRMRKTYKRSDVNKTQSNGTTQRRHGKKKNEKYTKKNEASQIS